MGTSAAAQSLGASRAAYPLTSETEGLNRCVTGVYSALTHVLPCRADSRRICWGSLAMHNILR
jgi:hypothetical protein